MSPWWTSTMRSRSRSSRSWSIFFSSCVTSFIPFFLKRNRMKIVLGTSRTCWSPWWTSTMRSRSLTSRSWSIFFLLSCDTSFVPIFLQGKSNENSFKCLQDLFGNHGGHWWRRPEGEHRENDPYFFCHVIHHFYLFFKGKSNENSFRYLWEVPKTIFIQ